MFDFFQGNSIKSSKDIEVKYRDTVDSFLWEDDDNVYLERISVNERGQGTGTQFMNELIEYANRSNKNIILEPDEDLGGDLERLKEFYSRFGFSEDGDKMRYDFKEDVSTENDNSWYKISNLSKVSGDEGLSFLLNEPNSDPKLLGYTGRENSSESKDGTEKYLGEFGSIRYVLRDNDGNIIASAQGVIPPDRPAQMSNIYVHPYHRRKGLAEKLVSIFESDNEGGTHSQHINDDMQSVLDKMNQEKSEKQPLVSNKNDWYKMSSLPDDLYYEDGEEYGFEAEELSKKYFNTLR